MNISQQIQHKQAQIDICNGNINASQRALNFLDLDKRANFKLTFQSLDDAQSGTVMLAAAEAERVILIKMQALNRELIQLEMELIELNNLSQN